ncbi:MAG: hypothetical protein OHK0036_09190 [Bacteroidia bacterium]
MKDIFETLDYEMSLLKLSIDYLNESYERCLKFGWKEKYTNEELIDIDALTSRFARSSDIIMKKIFRYLDEIELEPNKSILDRIHSAEKRNLISSSEKWKEIRNLRNYISHEYSTFQISETFKEVMNTIPEIITTYQNLVNYIDDLKFKYKNL